MRVEVTAMKNFPSNLGSLLMRARSRARVSREGPALIGSSIISSLHPDDWPFSDINSPSCDSASETGEPLPLPRSTVPVNSRAEWITRTVLAITPPRLSTRRFTMASRSTRVIHAAVVLVALTLPMDLAAQSYDVTILQGLGGGAGAN